MATFTVHQAKTNLSRLIADALAGEEVLIAPHGKEPAVRIVPVEGAKKKPLLGAMAGRISLDDGFFDPMTEEELSLWYDGKI